MEKNAKTYWTLFSSTFYLSAFTLGGGYVIVPLMQKKFVEDLGWIDEDEMLNLVALGQSCPGPIAVNTSILVGYRVAGLPGALVTVLGTALPPLITISIIALFYQQLRDNKVVAAVLKGMQAGVAAVILDVVIGMAGRVVKRKEVIPILVMLGAFAATYFLKVNVMYIILVCGFLGFLLSRRKEQEGAQKGGDGQ